MEEINESTPTTSQASDNETARNFMLNVMRDAAFLLQSEPSVDYVALTVITTSGQELHCSMTTPKQGARSAAMDIVDRV